MKTPPLSAVVPSLILLAFLGLLSPHQTGAQQSGGDSAAKEKKLGDMASRTYEWMQGKLSSPGMTADVREVGRSNDTGKLMVQFQVFVTGAPKDKIYTLIKWPVTDEALSEGMKGLSLGEDGIVMCAGKTRGQCGDPNAQDNPAIFRLQSTPGEIFRFALISTDNKTHIFFTIIPDPLINTSGKCSLEAIRLLPGFEMALIRAKGFQPNEELGYFDKSVDEVIDHKIKADSSGGYVSMLLPGVIGHDNGTENVKITGAGCAPEVTFNWGH